MINLFGISGAYWSLGIQIAGFVISLGLGLSGYKRNLGGVAVVIGVVSDIVGQMIFAGEGPGAFVGFFILPLYCMICAFLGRGIWWLAYGRYHPPIPPGHCKKCGYNLTGNVSGICPECGTGIGESSKAA